MPVASRGHSPTPAPLLIQSRLFRMFWEISEPASVALLGVNLLSLGLFGRKRARLRVSSLLVGAEIGQRSVERILPCGAIVQIRNRRDNSAVLKSFSSLAVPLRPGKGRCRCSWRLGLRRIYETGEPAVPAAQAAKNATRTVPIVVSSADAVGPDS